MASKTRTANNGCYQYGCCLQMRINMDGVMQGPSLYEKGVKGAYIGSGSLNIGFARRSHVWIDNRNVGVS